MRILDRPMSPNKLGPDMQSPRSRRKRFSPLVLVGLIVTLVIVLGAGVFVFIQKQIGSHAAAVNADCTLIVPPNPLTAKGLATPYQLVATDPNNGPCNETNTGQSAFVQGAVFDPETGQISAYNPLVIDKGTQPAVAPVVPTIPQGAVVALWFGFNGNNLMLKSSHNSLNSGRCVNGVNGTIFGQFAYCNAPAFFQGANQAIRDGQLVVPALGIAKDGQICPTVRDFAIVDQDQSDNVPTTYFVSSNNQVAQATAANAAKLQNIQPLFNGSDNRLLDIAVDGALGCSPWKVNDLADPGKMIPLLPLNELQAAKFQPTPVALVPNLDPMTLVNNQRNMDKLNAYRAGVDQSTIRVPSQASTRAYCLNLMRTAPIRLALDAPFLGKAPSPDMGAADNLYDFMGQRFAATWTNLTCDQMTGKATPITVKTDANGVAVETMVNGINLNPTANPLTCNVNGTPVAGCTGKATINGQACAFLLDPATNQLNLTCPAKAITPPGKPQVSGQGQPPDPNSGKNPNQVKNQ